MKINKLYTSLLITTFICMLIVSCDGLTDFDKEYQGPDTFEFKPLSATVADGTGQYNVEVQLIGKQRAEATQVNFSVVDSMTTANSGTHYEITTPSPVSIPANSSSTVVTINVLDSGMGSNEARTLELAIDGDQEVSKNINKFDMTIVGN